MTTIKGITVTLYDEQVVGYDPFNKPKIEEVPIEVDNVLIAPTLSDDVVTTHNLTGRKAIYTLAIPKGDTHDWESKKIYFFGEYWRVFGIPLQGIDELIPLAWNKKVTVERYE